MTDRPTCAVNGVTFIHPDDEVALRARLEQLQQAQAKPTRTRGQEVAEKWYLNDYNHQKNTVGEAIQLLAAAIDAERRAVKEECAVVAERRLAEAGIADTAQYVAAAIRAMPG